MTLRICRYLNALYEILLQYLDAGCYVANIRTIISSCPAGMVSDLDFLTFPSLLTIPNKKGPGIVARALK